MDISHIHSPILCPTESGCYTPQMRRTLTRNEILQVVHNNDDNASYMYYTMYTQGIGSGRFILPPGVTLPAKLVPSARPKLLNITNTIIRSSTTLDSIPARYHYINNLGTITSQQKLHPATSVSSDPSTCSRMDSPTKVSLLRQDKSSPITIIQFLESQGRTVYRVLGDGNCMFKSLSHQLHGTEDKHSDVHLVVQKVMEENMEKYNSYWIQIETTFSQHVQLIKNKGVWGTQVELLAASDYYQLPIFVLQVQVELTSDTYLNQNPKDNQPLDHSLPTPLYCSPRTTLKLLTVQITMTVLYLQLLV